MSGTDSLSKGVFTFKREEKKKSERKSAVKRTRSPGVKLPPLYEKVRMTSGELLGNLEDSAFEAVQENVIEFLNLDDDSGGGREAIPTGAVVTGVNLSDHGDFFSSLALRIRKEKTRHIARVSSSSLTTLKALISSVVSQWLYEKISFIDADNHIDTDSSEDIKRRDLVLPVFQNWYSNQYPSKQPRPPCVVILEDLESINNALLQDLLYNLREFISTLPLVLLFGIATSVDAIHRALPSDLTSNLSIHRFSSQSSSQLFSQIVQKVVISNQHIPFKLGSKVFKLLFDIFLFHDFSIKNFLSGYKFCLLKHLSSNLGSLLSIPVSELSHNDLDVYRKCASFQDFIEDNISERSALLEDDALFRTHLIKALKDIESITNTFNLAVEIVYTIAQDLPKNPIGKYMHTTYLIALSEPFWETSEYRELFQLMGILERIDLEKIINRVISKCRENAGEFGLIGELERFLNRLEDPDELIVETSLSSLEESSPPKRTKLREIKPRIQRSEWKKALMENMKMANQKTLNNFETIRSQVLNCFHCYFRKCLTSPMKLPFHEVKFFNNSGCVKRHLIGDPRSSVQTALTYPGDYLENEDLSNIGQYEIPSSLPDLSIAFKLHSECGKLINVYDWLQCWLSVVNEGDEDPDTLQARFSQSVAELQFLGFIKPSKRKTDHVSRLTWGSC